MSNQILSRRRRRAALAGVAVISLCVLHARADDWIGQTGDWFDGTQWSDGNPPVDGDDTDINNPGTAPYIVTLDGDANLNSLSLDSSNATLDHTSGTLAVDYLNVNSGTYILDGGAITNNATGNATINIADSFQINSGTISAGYITGGGNLVMSSVNSSLTVLNGLGGDGSTQLNITGDNSTITLDGPANAYGGITFNATPTDAGDGATIYLGGPTTPAGEDYVSSSLNIEGSASIYDYAGGYDPATGYTYNSTAPADLENGGTINANIAGQIMRVAPSRVQNDGTLEATNGGILDIQSNFGLENDGQVSGTGGSVVNVFEWGNYPDGTISADASTLNLAGSGVNEGNISATDGATLIMQDSWQNQNVAGSSISIQSGSTATLEGTWSNDADGQISADDSTLNLGGTWQNLGSITVTDGSTLNLGGSFTYGDIGNASISADTAVNITGTLDNTTTTNSSPSYGGTWYLNGGTISGGQLVGSGSAISFPSGQAFTLQTGTFNGVEITGGDLDLPANSTLFIQNGITVDTGNLNFGSGAQLYFDGPPQTIDNLTISTPYYNSSIIIGDANGSSTLTLGHNATIQGSFTIQNSQVDFIPVPGSALINNGTIISNQDSAPFNIQPGAFTNNGLISAINAGVVTIASANWTNSTTGVITANGSAVNLNGNWTNNGTITLSNAAGVGLGGTFTVASIGSVNGFSESSANTTGQLNTSADSAIAITGVLNLNNTDTLYLNSSTGSWYLGSGIGVGEGSAALTNVQGQGTIENGTVALADGQSLHILGGTLSNVTVTGGDINLDSFYAFLTIENGLSVSTGNINANTGIDGINLYGTQALDNLNFNMDIPNGYAPEPDLNIGSENDHNPETLSFGPNLVVQGENFEIIGGGSQLLNYGTIDSNFSGQTIMMNLGVTLTNYGTLEATNGGTLRMNNGGILATAGTWNNYGLVSAGASSTVIVNGPVTNNAGGTFQADGGVMDFSAALTNNGTVQAINGGAVNVNNNGGTTWTNANLVDAFASSTVNLDSNSGAIVNDGTLRTDSGTIAIAIGARGSFTNAGTILLHGGIVSDTAALLIGDGTLTGWGTIDAAVVLDSDPSSLLFNIGGVDPDTGYDALLINGNLTLAGDLEIQFADDFQNSITPSDIFNVLTVNASDSLSGAFDNVADGGRLQTLDGLGSFQVNYGSGPDADEIVLSNFQAAPEPASWGLAIVGLLAIPQFRRRA